MNNLQNLEVHEIQIAVKEFHLNLISPFLTQITLSNGESFLGKFVEMYDVIELDNKYQHKFAIEDGTQIVELSEIVDLRLYDSSKKAASSNQKFEDYLQLIKQG